MKVAVVGATGLVGSKMLQVLEERQFPVSQLIPVASEKSVGKKVIFRGEEHLVRSMEEAIAMKPAIAVFSAGGGTSQRWAPEFAKVGTYVVDNSSAWRMDPKVKLVIPEINAGMLRQGDRIIANPNCSTIQMLMVLAPLHRMYRIKRIVVSTYQSVSGTGIKALRQLEHEERATVLAVAGHLPAATDSIEKAYPHTIYRNCIPQCDTFLENGYTKEEMKLVNETRKILGDNSIMVTATAVRVPVTGGHSEAVNLEFERDYDLAEVRKLLTNTEGIVVLDNPAAFEYPMALLAHERDEVFVGRIRRDESRDNCLNLWVVSDNLRKGAATNAVQIAEYLVAEGIVE